MKWVEGLRKWRRERNIKKPQGAFRAMVESELDEYEDAEDSVEERIDAIGDIIVLAVNEMELEGYNVDLVMKQIVKHISARVQLPAQALEWATNGPDGKWKKDPDQDPSTLYLTNFSLCKLHQD